MTRPASKLGLLPGARLARVGLGLSLVTGLSGVSMVIGGAAPASATFARPAITTTANVVWSDQLNDIGDPVAESSPIPAVLDGAGTSVVVGDRAGYLQAVHLSDGSSVAGWPASTGGAPVDATPSVLALPSGLDQVFTGAGNAAYPTVGGYEAFNPDGSEAWYTPVVDPGADAVPAYGVQASLAVGNLSGSGDQVVAGSLDEEEYELQTYDGSVAQGWPFWTADSVFSTAAIADLYGNGANEIIEGGDSSPGFGNGQGFNAGGHVRILNGQGGQICRYDANQVVQASPAVGDIMDNNTTGLVIGTGTYWPGASDTDRLLALDSQCHLLWSDQLDGSTSSSPALAPVMGNGRLQIAQGTDNGTSGSVWLIDSATGSTIWTDAGTALGLPANARVIGSVVTADLFGQGYQDVVVATTRGVSILDGRTGAVITILATDLGFQNSPLITDDANGLTGITVAGYNGIGQGVIRHYELTNSDGAAVSEPGSWPMFHHDPQLTGNAGNPPAGWMPGCQIPSAAQSGYQMVAADGGVFSFGTTSFCGSMGGQPLNAPIVGMARAPTTGGYWLVASDGGIFAFGGAQFYGSMGGRPLNAPIVGMAATEDGLGYWLVASDGGIFAFGDAQFYGSTGSLPLAKPVVAMTPSADGYGYWFVASDGGVFAFGDAQYFGSEGDQTIPSPVVGMATDPGTGGYWLVGSTGGVYSFNAPFSGSMGGQTLVAPIVGMYAISSGYGYWLVASDGGVFSFGSAQFAGSLGGLTLNAPIIGVVGS